MSSQHDPDEPSAIAPWARGVSRRTVLSGACLMVGSAAVAPPARASDKVPQKQANYQSAAKGGARCGACVQFLPPANCALVEGPISPSGWCAFFAPRPR